MKRSRGVTIIAWIIILWAVLALPGVLDLKGNFKEQAPYVAPWANHILNIYSLTYVIIQIVIGIGLLRLKRWARKGILILFIIGLFELFIRTPFVLNTLPIPPEIPRGELTDIIKHGMVKDVLFFIILMGCSYFGMIFFFMRPSVKQQFSQKSEAG